MKGNEVLLILKNKGFEKGTERVLLQLAEEIEDMRRTLTEFAKAFQTQVHVQGMMNKVLDGMDEKIKKFQVPDDGMGPTREGL